MILLPLISELYSSDKDHHVEQLQEGDACIARFSEDDQWHRAKVISAFDDVYTVYFVDLGSTETTSVSNLRRMAMQLAEEPAAGLMCALQDIVPRDQGKMVT